MKIAISLFLWCVLTIICARSQNQQIYFPQDDNDRLSAIVPRHITQDPLRYNKEVERLYVDGVTRLTLSIYNKIPETLPELANTNIALGPLTIACALSLILLTSVGQTSNEIAHFLGLTQLTNFQSDPLAVHEPINNLLDRIDTRAISSSAVNEVISYSTAIFVQHDFPIRPEFIKACESTYKSKIVSLDFKRNPNVAEQQINSWVSESTNGKIPKLFHGPPPSDTNAIFASVLYFKAAWEYPFFEGHTKPRPFFVNGRSQKSDRNVDMMANGGEFPYFKDRNLNLEIMGFPYKGERVTLYAVLPQNSDQNMLTYMEWRLTPDIIHGLVNATRKTEAIVIFPKLKIESSVNLKPILETFDINSIFNPQYSNLALLSPGISSYAQNPSAGGQSGSDYITPNLHTGQTNFAQSSSVPTSNGFVQNPPARAPSYPNIGIQNNFAQSFSTAGAGNFVQNQFQRTTTNYVPNIPTTTSDPLHDRLIFKRFPNGCELDIFNVTRCPENSEEQHMLKTPHYENRFNNPTTPIEDLDRIRTSPNLRNPGIYADQILHKVYIEITETGTEAASVTGTSLNRSGGRVSFRLDVPFLFFVYHEDSNIILFWGSVRNPKPSSV